MCFKIPNLSKPVIRHKSPWLGFNSNLLTKTDLKCPYCTNKIINLHVVLRKLICYTKPCFFCRIHFHMWKSWLSLNLMKVSNLFWSICLNYYNKKTDTHKLDNDINVYLLSNWDQIRTIWIKYTKLQTISKWIATNCLSHSHT